MSIQSQIDRINTAKSEIASAISAKGVAVAEGTSIDGLPALIRSIPQEGGSGGSGIIDVTELPTSGIDENAVYRVTENVQTEKNEVYVYIDDFRDTLQQLLAIQGVTVIPNIYVVDELSSDMKISDVQTFSELHIYILRSDGIAYINIPDSGGVVTVGLLVAQATGFDKGFTENINLETEQGVYTTLEAYKQVESWYIRESGEWKRISPDTQDKEITFTENGNYEILPDNGKQLSKVTVEVAVPTQGGGSDIIEVPELPTSNIDENAIYKVVVAEESTFYVIRNGAIIDEKTFIQSVGLKEIYKYFVDELPADMLETDTITGIAYGYVINSTGVGYLKIKGPGAILTFGAVAFSDVGYDKGYTADITFETQDGVYVQKGKHSEEWFYRESGEWVRITPEQENKQFTLATPLRTTVTPEEGKVFSSVTVDVGFKSIGDFIDRNITIDKITENDLTKTDGTALTYIREYAFAGSKVKSITLPSLVNSFSKSAFLNASVEEVTFKGKPNSLSSDLFSTCANLKTLNVSWGNGQVSGAPWGATNATINYNYTGE